MIVFLKLCAERTVIRQEVIVNILENVVVVWDGLVQHVEIVKFYLDVFMELVPNHWNADVCQDTQGFCAKLVSISSFFVLVLVLPKTS